MVKKVRRKLAAILAADVVGYSRLMGEDETGTLDALKTHREELIEPKIVEHEGRIVKLMGDGLLAEFRSAVEAVQCAVEIQHGMGKRNAEVPKEKRIIYRIGINIGDVIVEGDDLYGDGVNIAARLEKLAEPSGICISGDVHHQVQGKLEITFNDLGDQQMKNIAKPVPVFRVQSGQLAVERLKRSVGSPTPPDKPSIAVLPFTRKAIPPAAVLKRSPRRWAAIGGGALLLIVAIGIGVWQLYPASDEPPALALPDKPSIAVLPFKNLSGDPEQEYFVDGLTEEIITELTRFSGLMVIARNSTFQYKGRSVDVREVGRELGARYVVEGSVRKATDTIRVTAQLLDATSGAHLWAETYERGLTASNIFEVQDGITQKIVATLADTYGIIARVGLDEVKRKRTQSLEVYDCILRDNEYRRILTLETHLVARACLERAVELDPDYAEAWARLSHAYVVEYSEGLNPRPEMYDALDRGYDAAQRAAELDPANEWAHVALARALFFRREPELFFIEAERAVELNPNNADVIGTMGNYMAYAGQWERGLALIERAKTLSPFHPDWYHLPFVLNHYRKGEYEEALARAHQVNMPGFWWTHMELASIYGQLGRQEEARAAVAKLLELNPGFAGKTREQLRKWLYSEELVEHFLEGLRKAGLPE